MFIIFSVVSCSFEKDFFIIFYERNTADIAIELDDEDFLMFSRGVLENSDIIFGFYDIDDFQ